MGEVLLSADEPEAVVPDEAPVLAEVDEVGAVETPGLSLARTSAKVAVTAIETATTVRCNLDDRARATSPLDRPVGLAVVYVTDINFLHKLLCNMLCLKTSATVH